MLEWKGVLNETCLIHSTQVNRCGVGWKGEGSGGVFKHLEGYWNDIWGGLVLDIYGEVAKEML